MYPMYTTMNMFLNRYIQHQPKIEAYVIFQNILHQTHSHNYMTVNNRSLIRRIELVSMVSKYNDKKHPSLILTSCLLFFYNQNKINLFTIYCIYIFFFACPKIWEMEKMCSIFICVGHCVQFLKFLIENYWKFRIQFLHFHDVWYKISICYFYVLAAWNELTELHV